MVLARRNTALAQASQAVAYMTEEDALAIEVLLCSPPMTAGRLAPSESTSLRPRRDSGSWSRWRHNLRRLAAHLNRDP